MKHKIKRLREIFGSVDTNVNYTECKECASQCGSPLLCNACLANRKNIEDLKRVIWDAQKVINEK